MTLLLTLGGPLLAAALVALNLGIALRGPARLRELGRKVLRLIHRRAESVELWRPAPAAAVVIPRTGSAAMRLKGQRARPQAQERVRGWWRGVFHTRLGTWSILASGSFLCFWLAGWVPPGYHLGFLWHLGFSWAAGAAAASLAFAAVWSVVAAFRMGRAQLYASRAGLSKLWLAQASNPHSRLGEALREAFAAAPRIEVLDFTGYELIAKGPSDEGGLVAGLLARHPDKEARVLLFNPCGREIDPDRKHNTVVQSQLASMEMTREAFESKLRATIDRVEMLNRGRQKPIEVHLYTEKPSFRVLVAGDAAFLGAIDPRDASGEFPLYEARRLSDGPSFHAAIRAHFLRAWGDSTPVKVEALSTMEETPAERVETPSPRSRQSVA